MAKAQTFCFPLGDTVATVVLTEVPMTMGGDGMGLFAEVAVPPLFGGPRLLATVGNGLTVQAAGLALLRILRQDVRDERSRLNQLVTVLQLGLHGGRRSQGSVATSREDFRRFWARYRMLAKYAHLAQKAFVTAAALEKLDDIVREAGWRCCGEPDRVDRYLLDNGLAVIGEGDRLLPTERGRAISQPIETGADLAAWQDRLGLNDTAAAKLLRLPYGTFRNYLTNRRRDGKLPPHLGLLCRYVERFGGPDWAGGAAEDGAVGERAA